MSPGWLNGGLNGSPPYVLVPAQHPDAKLKSDLVHGSVATTPNRRLLAVQVAPVKPDASSMPGWMPGAEPKWMRRIVDR